MTDFRQSGRLAMGYQGPASGRRYEMWREEICRSFCRLDAGPSESDRIDCRVDFTFMHSLTLATPTGLSARFARTRELLTDGCDDLVLISASRAPVHVTQGEQTIQLGTSQACLVEMNAATSVALDEAGRFTTTRMPRHFLLQAAPKGEAKLSRPLGENQALITMIERYFALCSDVAERLDPVAQKTSAQHLIDLIGLLLQTETEQKEFVEGRRYSPARLNLLKAEVLQNLTRSTLTIDVVARANGLSARQAQRLFAQSGVTFTEFVVEQRLLLAHRILVDPQNRYRKISDIAYNAGFGDLSYFNRAFRSRFGVTPSDMRAETDLHLN